MKNLMTLIFFLIAIYSNAQNNRQSYERGNLAWVFPDLYFFGAEHGYDTVFVSKYHLNDAILISESIDSLQIALSLADHEHSQQQIFEITEYNKTPINETKNVHNLLPISLSNHGQSQSQTTVATNVEKKTISENRNRLQVYQIAKKDTLSFYVEPEYYIADDKLWVNDTFKIYISNNPESSDPWSIKFEKRDINGKLTREGIILLTKFQGQ